MKMRDHVTIRKQRGSLEISGRIYMAALCLFIAGWGCKSEPDFRPLTFTCVDQLGRPIEGVTIQIADANETTGEDGKAVFTDLKLTLDAWHNLKVKVVGADFIGPARVYFPNKKAARYTLNFYRGHEFRFRAVRNDDGANDTPFRNVAIYLDTIKLGETGENGALDTLLVDIGSRKSFKFSARAQHAASTLARTGIVQYYEIPPGTYYHTMPEFRFVKKVIPPAPQPPRVPAGPSVSRVDVVSSVNVKINTGSVSHRLLEFPGQDRDERVRTIRLDVGRAYTLKIKLSNKDKEESIDLTPVSNFSYEIIYSKAANRLSLTSKKLK